MSLTASNLHPETAVYRHTIPAGEPYLFEVRAGQTLRLHDLEGNQAIDTLFFAAANPRERFDPQRTLRKQNRVYLSTGTVLYSNLGNPLLTITADTCGRHDTLGGACAQESNTVRYALDKRYMHSCRDNFLRASHSRSSPIAKRLLDLVKGFNTVFATKQRKLFVNLVGQDLCPDHAINRTVRQQLGAVRHRDPAVNPEQSELLANRRVGRGDLAVGKFC